MWLCIAVLSSCLMVVRGYEDIQSLEDDDFAEFEQFEAEDEFISSHDLKQPEAKAPSQSAPSTEDPFEAVDEVEDDIIIEDEDSEFEHFQDPEEFEGFQDNPPRPSEQPKITISKVPVTGRPRWEAYWLEGILAAGLLVYASVYLTGRAKNTAIANNFINQHKPMLDENFTLVGETGTDVISGDGDRGWRRDAEHSFSMWCSGRTCCEGMLLTLKLTKRQDLVHVIIGLVKPSPDTLQIRIELGKDDSDPFILCVAQKKLATKLAREMQDLSVFCPERRSGDKHGLPIALSVMSEAAEATSAILDTRVCTALTQYVNNIQYIHISDRFSGPKQVEEQQVMKPPEVERVMLIGLTLGPDGGGDEVRPLLLLVFYLLEKLKRFRLSKEALAKCEKRRQKVAEAWQRGAHAARQEQAAQRREEKRKLEKERILAEDDPEKQRRWELKEQKRQMKRKTPKMKQLKVKAL